MINLILIIKNEKVKVLLTSPSTELVLVDSFKTLYLLYWASYRGTYRIFFGTIIVEIGEIVNRCCQPTTICGKVQRINVSASCILIEYVAITIDCIKNEYFAVFLSRS